MRGKRKEAPNSILLRQDGRGRQEQIVTAVAMAHFMRWW
jgi:hypothetical protein